MWKVEKDQGVPAGWHPGSPGRASGVATSEAAGVVALAGVG